MINSINTFTSATKATAFVESTTKRLDGVNLFWVKCNPEAPVSPFGTEQWEVQIHVPKERAAELEGLGVVKADAERKTAYVNLKKKATDREGNRTKAVRIVDALKQDMDSTIIGNGSTGNVLVSQRPYSIKTPQGKVQREGISTTLLAIQVTDLVKFQKQGGSVVDFFDKSATVTELTAEDDGY